MTAEIQKPSPFSKSKESPCFSRPFLDPKLRAEVYEGIKSGKIKLPSCVDPNIVFSEDEEEDDTVIPRVNLLQIQEEKVMNDSTPLPYSNHHDPNFATMRAKVYDQVRHSVRNPYTIEKAKQKVAKSVEMHPVPPKFHPRFAVPFSHGKSFPATHRTEFPAGIYKNSENVPLPNSKSRQNLMSRPEFQLPVTEDVMMVNGCSYQILSELGSGGSSIVYLALDLEKRKPVALKKVIFKNADMSMQEGYRQEISHLELMRDCPYVIRMHQYQYTDDGLLIVLELGDMDFARYMCEVKDLLCPIAVRFFWSQMLKCVKSIHDKGLVHSDLKPANFVLVGGRLKLIDFGIAACVPEDATSALRDRYVGTLNYMSPEAITQYTADDSTGVFFKVKASSDVWSLGCILYGIAYGRTPFQDIRGLYPKMQAISDFNHKIPFPPLRVPYLMQTLKLCLQRDPKERASIEQLLEHPYITGKQEEWITHAQSLSPQKKILVQKYIQRLAEAE